MHADLVKAVTLVGIKPRAEWADAVLWQILGDALIERHKETPEELLAVADRIITESRRHTVVRPITRQGLSDGLWLSFDASPTKVCVWRGDICTLSSDAVVNAANDEGLGCFVPSHKCIDNVLHRAAGPRLREACRKEMQARAPHKLTAGTAPLVTSGFCLPSRYVLHVTGPCIGRGGVSAADEAALASCYKGCLDACKARGLRSIAFPCISTGLFGYPPKQAANTALGTVRDWIHSNSQAMDVVIFDVFTSDDHAIYSKAAPMLFSPASSEEKTSIPSIPSAPLPPAAFASSTATQVALAESDGTTCDTAQQISAAAR